MHEVCRHTVPEASRAPCLQYLQYQCAATADSAAPSAARHQRHARVPAASLSPSSIAAAFLAVIAARRHSRALLGDSCTQRAAEDRRRRSCSGVQWRAASTAAVPVSVAACGAGCIAHGGIYSVRGYCWHELQRAAVDALILAWLSHHKEHLDPRRTSPTLPPGAIRVVRSTRATAAATAGESSRRSAASAS